MKPAAPFFAGNPLASPVQTAKRLQVYPYAWFVFWRWIDSPFQAVLMMAFLLYAALFLLVRRFRAAALRARLPGLLFSFGTYPLNEALPPVP